MYQQLDDMQTTVESVNSIPVFGYVETALDTDTGIPGHNEYSDANANNIPLVDGTELSLQEMEKGFRDSISTLSRAFFTHFFGRSSYNINKLRMLFSDMLDTCKADYAHNFRAWDSTAVYAEDDVCFLVANGIRYCFKSLVNNNTESISVSINGIITYGSLHTSTSTHWSLLTEVRTVQHPIGKPFLWFGGDLPDNYICFSDGGQHTWAQYPELDNPEFRVLLTRFTWKGARANDQNFTVPTINELYPMSVAEVPEALSTIGAKVPAHHHALVTGTVYTNSTTSTNHTHSMTTSTSGNHRHYTGDYQSTQHSVEADGGWHEDSKFDGKFGTTAGKEQDFAFTDTSIYLTPNLAAATFGNHSVTAPDRALAHTHSGTVTPSGAGDFGVASGKYRPGTIKTILAVRAS